MKTAILEEKSFKKVIVTHHVPTMLIYPSQYKGSALNQAFATELSEFIKENEIDYWLYGHHHYNSDIFEIGRTKLLTNQLDMFELRSIRIIEMMLFLIFNNNW